MHITMMLALHRSDYGYHIHISPALTFIRNIQRKQHKTNILFTRNLSETATRIYDYFRETANRKKYNTETASRWNFPKNASHIVNRVLGGSKPQTAPKTALKKC